MKIKIATVGLAHEFECGFEHAREWLEQTTEAIEKTDVICKKIDIVMDGLSQVKIVAENLRKINPDLLVVCIGTWSEDHNLLDLLSMYKVPILLRAYHHVDSGSLCCAHQIGAVFTDIGIPYEFVYGEPESEEAAIEVREIGRAYALKRYMSTVRTGAIGGRVKGMTEIAYDEFSIKKYLGSRVINLDEQEMLDNVKNADTNQAKKIVNILKQRGYICHSSNEDLMMSAKYYIALKKLAEVYELQCLSVKCYTKYMGRVCLGYSLLAEDGIMCACEGDVNSSLSMQILYALSEKPINNTDLLHLDPDNNTILYAHCGSSGFSIADSPIDIAPVRLASHGCCCLFTVKPGPVTLLNVVGHGDQFRIATMEGESVHCGMEFQGNPVKVLHKKPVLRISSEIMRNGIGHHWMVGYGNYEKTIEKFCEIQNIQYFSI